jgi:hypothetical protein
MADRPLLTTLLSRALVAFTIEFDNEAERRVPHRTTEHGRTAGSLPAPWLASMAMWFNCLRWVGEQGITLGEMQRLARTPTNLDGMQRWGYIYLAPHPDDARAKPPQKDWLVRATPGGRAVQRVWEPLLPEIEARWRERFQGDVIERLRTALVGLVSQLDPKLPDCMPIVGYGLFSTREQGKAAGKKSAEAAESPQKADSLELPALLARVLVGIATEFEADSDVSLALSANLLRLLDERPQAIRELPDKSGISKELIAVGTGWLDRSGYAVIETAGAPERGKKIRLNEKGLIAQQASAKRLARIEKGWEKRFGNRLFNELSDILHSIAEDGTASRSRLFEGLTPYPENWRAKVAPLQLLPQFPMVSHRGGYPDGS